MERTSKNIFLFMELSGGAVRNSSLELFTAARAVSNVTGGKIIAVILGENIKNEVSEVSMYGPDTIICVDDPQFTEYSNRRFTNALCALVKKYTPDAVMISATKTGKDLAPRLARRLGTGITANCCELRVEAETGLISWNMPAPGGIMATILCSDTRPQMGTICPGAFQKPNTVPDAEVEVIAEKVESDPLNDLQVIEKILNPKDAELNITEADIIVAGGRGMGSADNFSMIRELASCLGAAVGASRSVVDAEWIDAKHLIGQTGKMVRPKLYIACGISGALQHMVGVSDAECIVAINLDETAPIFDYADYAIVGDAKKIIPALIDALKK